MNLNSSNDTVFYFPSNAERNAMLACGIESYFEVDVAQSEDWIKLDAWLSDHQDWRFGWICYEAKNAIENLPQRHSARLGFPQMFFFVPENLVEWVDRKPSVLKGKWNPEFEYFFSDDHKVLGAEIKLTPSIDHTAYVSAVRSILDHIHRGDIYEVNFCQSFTADARIADPLALWKRVYTMTEAPFSVFAKHHDFLAFCGSPERFLKRTGNRLISQPIKGTIRRGRDKDEDERRKSDLYNSRKERSENVMIVDLVRNDLSRSARKGSVRVDELFGVYSFKTVHHMISTVSAEVDEDISFGNLMRDSFPMGSMTGAPKIRSMEIIDQYESSARELYSGTIGYIKPNGDFDFNVVIRSLLYNAALPFISLSVGGAITAQCDAESEYEECMLKASALLRALGHETE